MGSDSDLTVMEAAAKILKELRAIKTPLEIDLADDYLSTE